MRSRLGSVYQKVTECQQSCAHGGDKKSLSERPTRAARVIVGRIVRQVLRQHPHASTDASDSAELEEPSQRHVVGRPWPVRPGGKDGGALYMRESAALGWSGTCRYAHPSLLEKNAGYPLTPRLMPRLL